MTDRINFLEVLKPDQVREIHLTALRLMEEVGLLLPYQEVLERLNDAGAQVNFDDQTVRIPAYLVESSIQKMPSRFTFYSRNPKYSLDMNGLDTYFSGPNAAINVIDLEGRRRPGIEDDGIKFSRLADALPNYDIAGTGIYPPKLPPKVLEAWTFMTTLIHANKPVLGISTDGDCARVHIQMAEVVADACGLTENQLPLMAVCNTKSPLSNSPEELEALVEYARRGVPVMISPEVMAGATGPVTLAGSMAQATAEFLCHATIAQLIKPGVPVMFGCVSSVFDMRQMILPYGAPEADLFSMATAQMARYYGIPSRGTGGSSDANSLGMQAGVESLMSILSCLLAGVTYVNHAGGELENTLACSFEKTVIDDEIIGMARRLVRGIEVTRETLAFDSIKEVGPRGDFLSTDHTLKYFKTEHFLPTLLDRDKYDVWEETGGKRVEERARDRVNQLLDSHEPEQPMPDEAVRELEAIYAAKRSSAGLE